MKSPLRLDREEWLRALAAGRMDLGLSLSGFSTVGKPGSPWGFQQRQLDAGICYFLINGSIRARLSSRTLEINEGTLFLLAPGVRHDFELLDREKPITLYHFRLQPRLGKRSCWWQEEASFFQHMFDLRPFFEELMDEFAGNLPWKEERRHALFFLIFSTAFRSSRTASGKGLTLGQQARLVRFLRQNAGSQSGPADLAAVLHLSHDYFSRLFKASYGVIPRVWLVRERLRLASLDLAETRKSVTQIAEDLGYRNTFLFSRQFSRQLGISPSGFRRRHHME
jgi:AraC-like DNA-binding protein